MPNSSTHWNRRGAGMILLVAPLIALLSGCNSSKSEVRNKNSGKEGSDPGIIEVSTAQALGRRLPIVILATGSFLADEAADVTAEVDGTVAETPVDVGRFVKQGEVLFRLDDRTPRLRLEQAIAAAQQAQAALRQAEARLGIDPGSSFDPKSFDLETVPEVAGARANYESAHAQAALSESDERRYATLLKTGDIAQSLYDQARTRAKSAREQANAARQQYEGALNAARQAVAAVGAARAALEAAHAHRQVPRRPADAG